MPRVNLVEVLKKNCFIHHQVSSRNVQLVAIYLLNSIMKQKCGPQLGLTLQDVWDKSICQAPTRVTLPEDGLLKMLKMVVREQPQLFETIAADPHGTVSVDFYHWLGQRVAQGESNFADIKTGYVSRDSLGISARRALTRQFDRSHHGPGQVLQELPRDYEVRSR